jgi:hypothetical protein
LKALPLAGRVWEGVRTGGPRAAPPRTPHPALRATFPRKGGRESGGDYGENSIEVPKHFVVPEAKDAISPAFQESGALGVIVDPVAMLAAVDFDEKLRIVTGDVGIIRADRYLIAEMDLRKGPAKPGAQRPLGRRHLPPEGARTGDGRWRQVRRDAKPGHQPRAPVSSK